MEEIIKSLVFWLVINLLMIHDLHILDENAHFSNIRQYEKHTMKFQTNGIWQRKYFLLWRQKKRVLKLAIILEVLVFIIDIVWICMLIEIAVYGHFTVEILETISLGLFFGFQIPFVYGLFVYRKRR